MRKLLCFLGFHKWRLNREFFRQIIKYPINPTAGCIRCGKWKREIN